MYLKFSDRKPVVVRIVTGFRWQVFHYAQDTFKLLECGGGNCLWCMHLNPSVRKTRPRWRVGVINRTTGNFEILQGYRQLYEAIQNSFTGRKLNRDPVMYDLAITHYHESKPSDFRYEVDRMKKSSLSTNDLFLIYRNMPHIDKIHGVIRDDRFTETVQSG